MKVYVLFVTFCGLPNFPRMRSLGLNGTMAADSALLLSLVEEYVSGLQDSKAGDTAAGKHGFITFYSILF